VDESAQYRRIERIPHAATLGSTTVPAAVCDAELWITTECQLEAAAAGADGVELLDELDDELELSDFEESDFVSDEPPELDDSELVEEPLDELFAASRLSVR
jgi:hypothetical protein